MAPTKKICRQYSSEFLQYGFIPSPKNKTKPMCVVCQLEMANESMRSAKLKQHLEKKHPDMASKPIEFFKGFVKSSSKEVQLVVLFPSKIQKKRKVLWFLSRFLG